jgi:hypothetical protein
MYEREFSEFVLSNMPYFISVNFQRLLEAETLQDRVKWMLHIYNLVLRALTLGLVSQYLTRDRDKVSDSYLNQLLLEKFPRLTPDAWKMIFFASLKVYEGNRDLFFMPELYDFYWDTSTLPHQPRPEVEQPFERLTQITVELRKEHLRPKSEREWSQLAEEAGELLHRFLQNLFFIRDYDIIRVVDYNEYSYDFELHRGAEISILSRPLPPRVNLRRGHFYLKKGETGFLLLHPFLVIFEVESGEDGLLPEHIGVYDRFIYAQLQYLLVRLSRDLDSGEDVKVVRGRRVREFIRLVFDTIEEAKHQRQEVEKLTWLQLRDICKDITDTRMATVKLKYHRELYLQREKSRQAFEGFLASEKRCFVLIGKAGVGKSNFLLALGEELYRSRNDICVLMYDGANLKVEPSITHFIGQDFRDRITLAGQPIQQMWQEIGKIDGMETRLVVLCVDAVNESPRALELLRQLDELVQKPWPWLKIVFSSRPETWKKISQDAKLAEALYYSERQTEGIGLELESFSYSEQMEPFSRDEELPEAYARYQQAFNLRTGYESLRDELRNILREPLNLWWLANTYKEKQIPLTLTASELLENYIRTLLTPKDLRFLESDLVPLMTREGSYSNAISITDIDKAGEELYEAVFSEQVLSDGQQANQSFINLLDAAILVRQEQGLDQKIAFKYERLYEYFVGKRVIEKYEKRADKISFFEELVGQLKEKLFLWGVLHNLLEKQLADLLRVWKPQNSALIRRLGDTTDVFQADLVASVIANYYSQPEYQAALKPILWEWLEQRDEQLQAPRITANVALACLIDDVLEQILIHPSDRVRFYVVQEIYELWKRDRALTTRLLQTLAAEISLLRMRRSLSILNTLLYASLLLTLRDYLSVGTASQGIETLRVVREVWRPIIEKFLFVSRFGFIESCVKGRRRGLVRFALDLGKAFFKGLERERFTFSLKDIGQFFPADDRQKQIIEHLTAHFDVGIGQAPEPVGALTAYVADLARHQDDNLVIAYAAYASFIAHIKADPLRTAQALEGLHRELEELYPPATSTAKPTASVWYPMTTYPFLNLPFQDYVNMGRERAKQILAVLIRAVRIRDFHYRDHWYYGCGDPFRIDCIEELIFGYGLHIPEVGRDVLEELVHFYVTERDHDKLRWASYSIAIGMERYNLPEPGVELYYDFIQLLRETGYFEQLDEAAQADFWQKSADDLLKFAGRYQQYLVDMLDRFEEQHLPEAFRVRIRNASPKESIMLNTGEAVAWAMSNALKDKSPFFRNFLKWLFCTATETKSLVDLILELIIYLIDFVYVGESLFSGREDPCQQKLKS